MKSRFSFLSGKSAVLAVSLLVAFLSTASASLPQPSRAVFAKGAKFTVSGYTGGTTLTGFPVLVRIGNNSPVGFSYNDVQNAYAADKNDIDIAFVDMDGTGLPFEIDTWDPQGTSLLWVRLPSMTTGTEFVMCWGSSSSGKIVCGTNPWGDYAAVWHMNETGTPSSSAPVTIHDSTANGLDGSTPVGKAASGSMIGGAWRIAEDNNHDRAIRVPVGGSGADPVKKAAADELGTDFHASFWVRAKGVVQWSNLICRRKGDQGTGWGFSFHENSGSTPKLMRVYAGGTTPATSSTTYNLGATLSKTDDVWKKVDVVWRYASNNNVQVADIYLNGAYLETVTCLETANQQDTDIGIGCSTQDSYNSSDTNKKGRRANAEMDEVRLRKGAPANAVDWFAADYATQSDPAFLSAGMAEDYVANDNPHAGISVASVAYTNATLTATVLDLGGSAASADVSVSVATDDQFASVVWTGSYTLSAADTRTLGVSPLATNTTYYARLVAENPLGGAVTNTVSFTTLAPGAPAGTATFQERGFSTLTATATATYFGVGAEGATLRLEASTDGFATVVAGAEEPATLGEAASVSIASGLAADTEYALRVRIRNDWGLETFVALSDTATRAVPFATTGIGWTFSQDGSTIAIDFGVSGVYDGATGTATLTYNGQTVAPAKAVSVAGTLTWAAIPVANGTATATIVLSASLGGQTYSQTFTATIAPGSMTVSVTDIASHASTADAVLVHVGDVVTLPELSGTASYIVGNKLFGSLDGNVLTALRPGILGIHCVDNESNTNTLPVIVLPDVAGSGEVYVFDETGTGNSTFNWATGRMWRKISGSSANQWPQNPDDVAILALYSQPGGKGMSCDVKNLDVTVGALYAGHFKNLASSFGIRKANGDTGSRISFRRTDGQPAVLQLCPNTLENGRIAEFKFNSGSLQTLAFLSDTMISGGWDGTDANYPRGRFTMGAQANSIPEGVTVVLRDMDTKSLNSGEYTFVLGNLSGAGTFWNRSSGLVKYDSGSENFTGLIRDSGGHGANGESQGREGPAHFRTSSITNAAAEVVGWVPSSNGQDPSNDFRLGAGALMTGWPHTYQAHGPHEPWFPARGTTMHGGLVLNRREISSAWTNSPDNAITRDIKQTDFLSVLCGLNYIYGDCNAANPDNDFLADAFRHENKATLGISDQSVFESNANTNMSTVLHGVSAYAVGAGGDPRTSNAASIVPWITTRAGSKTDEDLRFAAFDAGDRLSRIVHDKDIALSSYGATDNAYVFNKDLSMAESATLNSLALYNDAKNKLPGAGKTLTLTSGGLILGDIGWSDGSAAIGTENGGDANGALVLGDATHPGYVWARGSAANPNQIWAKVTAPGGFVAAYTGHLVLGGDQTGIGDELVVNAGTLQLGTAMSGCTLTRDLPVRVFANATLACPAENGFAGTVLRFDGSAGWFGKVDLTANQRCRKLYWRDYPETPEWQNLPRGTYGSSDSTAEFVRDDLFTGTGVLTVASDDQRQPTVINLR